MGKVEELRQMFADNPELKQQMLAQIQGQQKQGLLRQFSISPKASNIQKIGLEESLRTAKQDEAIANVEAGGFQTRPKDISGSGETGYTVTKTAEEKLQEIEDAVNKERALGEVKSEQQAITQKSKDVRESRADLTNARLKINNAFDSWLEMVDRTQRISGVGPGIMGGAITEVMGKTRTNEFVKAFKGGLTEYAAAVGRIAIPGARAVRLVNLFKETAPTTFDTVPSAIEQTALSFKNGLASDMRLYPEEYIPGLAPGARLTEEHYGIIQDYLRDFQNQYREGLYKQAYDKNPELLPPHIRQRFEAEGEGRLIGADTDDEINALLDREQFDG